MKYYIIPAGLAIRLNVTLFRHGNNVKGYVVNSGDLSVIGLDAATELGAREVTKAQAKEFIDNL